MLSPRKQPRAAETVGQLEIRVERLGMVVEPGGDPTEARGILNPGATRASDRKLLLYPRCVAEGNISRVGTIAVRPAERAFAVERLGFALEPHAAYELRAHPGYGCEDPRVTYLEVIESYVMAYTAFGPDGPRIALAISDDAYHWRRLGLVRFAGTANVIGDDKDAAFFPEPVISPTGRRSLAFYHRPMLHLSSVDGRAAIPMIERMPFEDRESIRIAYVPLGPALKDRSKLCDVSESVQVLSPDANWGSIKIGAGTPPVRIALNGMEAWMSLFHGVDLNGERSRKPSLRYRAGIVIHDIERPDVVLYRSPQPVLAPQTPRERRGAVDNVVFPTGLDPRPDLGERTYDVYYGMADYSIGAARLWIDPC
ncbi:MAG: glycosidase [Candidatus Eremiobacteraeota bacterium]|nr:glycosidase [Candidatus Eremiobacteraeota bacterium]